MTDLFNLLGQLKRPALLIRAARNGAEQYNRSEHLHRVLAAACPPPGGPALIRLMEIERDLNRQRRSDRASYSCARHVEVLIAIMGEARLLRASETDLNTV